MVGTLCFVLDGNFTKEPDGFTPLDNSKTTTCSGEPRPFNDGQSCDQSPVDDCPGDAACDEAACDGSSIQGDDACPIPLSVPQVLEAFHEQTEPWKLQRDGYEINGRAWGTGPTLLFLNGLAGTSELYALAAWVLHKHYRCLFFDYPGTTANDDEKLKPTVDAWADDVVAIAEKNGEAPVHLFASSLGTVVGLSAMCKQPDLFGKAVLYGCVTNQKFNFVECACLRMLRLFPFQLKNVPLRSIFQSNNHLPWFPGYDRPRWQLYLDITGQTPAKQIAQRALMLSKVDAKTVANVQSPVLLIGGEGEGQTAETSRKYLEQRLPNSSSSFMHTAGQVPFFTHPHRVAKIVNEFLQQ